MPTAKKNKLTDRYDRSAGMAFRKRLAKRRRRNKLARISRRKNRK